MLVYEEVYNRKFVLYGYVRGISLQSLSQGTIIDRLGIQVGLGHDIVTESVLGRNTACTTSRAL